MNVRPSGSTLPFTILSRPRDRWKVDRALADKLREDAALIGAKPAEVIAVRNVALPIAQRPR